MMNYKKVEKEVFKEYASSISTKTYSHLNKIERLAKYHVGDIIANKEASTWSSGGTFDTKFNIEMLDLLFHRLVGLRKDWERVKVHKDKDSFYKEISEFYKRLKFKRNMK